MGAFVDWLENLIFEDVDEEKPLTTSQALTNISNEDALSSSLWAYKLALNIACERIGAVLSRCDFKTYIGGVQSEGENYYLLNTEPNPNQSAAEFRKQLVRRLIFDPNHDALIVILDKVEDKPQAMYIAESFAKGDFAVNSTWFTNVTINPYGDTTYALKGTFSGNKAIYIKYTNNQLNSIFNMMKNTYGLLIENAEKAGTYRMKYVLTMDSTAENAVDFEENMQDILDNQFSNFIKGENAVLPLYAGMKLDQTSAGADLGQNASVANKSVNTQVDDAIAKVGLAFNIPKTIMLGEFAEVDIDPFLMFCINPLAELITQAFNRKWYGSKNIMSGTYCSLDTKQARNYDLISISNPINKIISSGVYTINEVRKELGESEIDPSIGDIHWITQNYAVIGDYVNDPTKQVGYDNKNSKNATNNNEQENEND